ncbi:replication restart DNA helicase PriA [Caloramator quimbayensis]|uniref:Replication restart protein PriA n=1 Tax=Caloramator quimbayensis TaxID=1147123 RepID=A0A1T4XTD7_9CLOT|nr:primosomal protein N' [Caloramator quimbayensis]SKA92428.1 replication restart DNA helicase PriA [Caloramator quimbayensis]
MPMIASVIVNNTAKVLDKEFEYYVPENMKKIIKRGQRVVVPFGKGNNFIEGIIIDIKDVINKDMELKEIIDIIDDVPLFNDSMINLAMFLKQKYNCTLIEAFKTIMPSGINSKEKLIIKFLSDKNYVKNKKIVEAIKKYNTIDYNKLCNVLNFKIPKSTLYDLKNDGIIAIDRIMDCRVKVKKVEVYSIADIKKCDEFIKNSSQKLKKQIETLKIIMSSETPLTLKEISLKSDCSSSVVKSLEKKGLIAKYEKEIYRNPVKNNYTFGKFELTKDQKNTIDNIIESYKKGKRVSLIYGVTGCGKTEIYLNAVENFIKMGYDAIVLVPEISLTPQTVERFKGRFGDVVAVLHSRLSDGERYDEWRRIKSGEVKVVVGARSAIFAPLNNIKLIIIDEEHEYSYKSEMTPKYHTREVAEYIVNENNGLLILGSATPSMESYYKAVNGEYNLIQILKRVDNMKLPDISVIDMREELKNGNKSMFSRELYTSISDNLKKGEQTILFLNRRGYSTFVSCRSCGYILKCKNCDVPLTYHVSSGKLSCHYCGFEYNVPKLCPKCQSKYIKYFGAGTEKVEEEIKKNFKDAKILRMDVDTTRIKGAHEKIYNEFKNNNADILIGTQMISKGMDFKNVTLVGIIAADTNLNVPDFRAAERTFQLVSQVSGRAGRGEKAGKVILQTYEPEHYSIVFSSNHDYIGFYNKEIEIRRALNYPPFSDILNVLLMSEDENELIEFTKKIKNEVNNIIRGRNVEVLGPAPCHIYKIKKSYRWHIILKGKVYDVLNDLNYILNYNTINTSINYSLDINSYNMI